MSTETSSYEMQVRKDEVQKETTAKTKPALSSGKIFYRPGLIEEETDETSVLDSSVIESPILGIGYGESGFLRPPLHQSSSLHRVPTYSSSIGHSTVYRHDICR
ncbi:unnamed protein product [Euphydryas editha]|uniref:Uncharacterized protein n=1 Tax=Euphydryas editha TaxID=104508 RepID=A0AAU9V7V6_EUPED|nr:unnamed protein product [Euphydryas editha]